MDRNYKLITFRDLLAGILLRYEEIEFVASPVFTDGGEDSLVGILGHVDLHRSPGLDYAWIAGGSKP
jgi:hypothetical protein